MGKVKVGQIGPANALLDINVNNQSTKTPKSTKASASPRTVESLSANANENQNLEHASPKLLTPIPEEPLQKSSVKKTPIQSFIELSRSNEVSPQRLEEELSKVLEGESVDAAITSPIFNEWLSKIGIRDAINTPVRLELKHLKCASHENEHLKKLLEKVKEVELEIAAEEAKSAAQLWDCLEQECSELQTQNNNLRVDLEAAQSQLTQNNEDNDELRTKLQGMYTDLQRTEEESSVLKKHVEELNQILENEIKSAADSIGITRAEITETAKDLNQRVEEIIAERLTLEQKLKEALDANKQRHEEQHEMKEKLKLLEMEKKEVCTQSMIDMNAMVEKCRRLETEKESAFQTACEEKEKLKRQCELLLKEKEEADTRAQEEQKGFKAKYEALEKEKLEACEKALQACEEILLEQATMKEEYERVEKEKEKSYAKILATHERALKDYSELKQKYEELEGERAEASAQVQEEQDEMVEKYSNLLNAKEEAYKIVLAEKNQMNREFEGILKEKDEVYQKALNEKTKLLSELEHYRDLAEKNSRAEKDTEKGSTQVSMADTKAMQKLDISSTATIAEKLLESESESEFPVARQTKEETEASDTNDIGLKLWALDGNNDNDKTVKVEINFDKAASGTTSDATSRRHSRLKKAKDDVFEAALLHVRLKKFKERNRNRSRVVFTAKGLDISAEECRRRASALGLRTSPIMGKRYSRT